MPAAFAEIAIGRARDLRLRRGHRFDDDLGRGDEIVEPPRRDGIAAGIDHDGGFDEIDGADAPLGGTRTRERSRDAIAILFVRDPLGRNAAATRMLRALYGLTEAEANLAQALQAGVLLADYAREHAVTLNTVYTHLRRIKDKTGYSRIAALTRKLKELQVSVRTD